ncbi:TetR family transcriptional regulator [Sphaerisporangium rufum]|uniref:TetR family transcriptional regulator n=1 Tax=Sphaerisporangium rufum TaxID=1381558 RepID=A0A919R7Q6_9ACTN|nr:TetR/AcrR family transcriptional regulator [Sphaerisporangium rufum]GII80738.1 TetR family transcriptional regulator [Sphaerisporangium rufum]
MGNREDLLAGAKRCLYEKGYARTTARDIAAASGVASLAAIGYHFGSKEALLNAALHQAMEEWGEGLGRALATATGPASTPAERFQAVWTAVIRTFEADRPLWAMQFELLAHIHQTPELGTAFTEAAGQARHGLAELFGDLGVTLPAEQAGALYHALLAGVAAQWLVDPDGALTGPRLTEALRALGAALGPPADPVEGDRVAG